MILVRVQEHEEILCEGAATIVIVREFVNGRFVIVDVDALRVHPLIPLGRKWSNQREFVRINVLRIPD
jgi:hypothetical protein